MGEILGVLTTKFLKRCPVKIWFVLMTTESLSRCPVKNITVLRGVPVKIVNVLTAKFLRTGNNKVLNKRTEVVFSSHSFGLFGQSSEYLECIRLVLSFTQQAAQMTKPFLFSFKHGVMILRVGARTPLVLRAKQYCS